MKVFLRLFTITMSVFLLPASLLAKQGPGTSGGGGAFACRNADGTLRDSELVDLWEARNLDGQAIEVFPGDPWAQAEKAAERLRELHPGLANGVLVNLSLIADQILYVPPGVLTPPRDVNQAYQKPGCPLSGMMFYDGVRSKLVIDNAMFNALLSDTERAAALLHEALYKTLREDRSVEATDSVTTRRIVGCLFGSDAKKCLGILPPSAVAVGDGDTFRCQVPSDGIQFWLRVLQPRKENGSDLWGYVAMLEKIEDSEVRDATYFTQWYATGPDGVTAPDPGPGNPNQNWTFAGWSDLGIGTFGYGFDKFYPLGVEGKTSRSRDELLKLLPSGLEASISSWDANDELYGEKLVCTRIP